MIRNILIGLVILVIGGSLAYNVVQGNRTEVTNATSTAPVVEEEQYPEDVLERARIAQEDVLHRYNLNEELSSLRAESSELDARIESIEKELGEY